MDTLKPRTEFIQQEHERNMKQEQFDILVKKLDSLAQKHPDRYRFRVALFAGLGYLYIALVLSGLLTLFGLVVLYALTGQRINIYVIKFGVLSLIPAWIIVRSLWVTFSPPEGLKLSRKEVPHLFAVIDELTIQLQAPRFHNVLLNRDFNAAVVQVPRLGIFGWQQNYLLLGLPLMQALSLEQLKAVLAHELGHLSGNHSRFAGWIYRVRKTWMQIYERLHQNDQQGAAFLFNGFLNWYSPSFSAYSFVLARMNEYEADRCAARLAGAEHTAAALVNIEVKARYLDSSFWSSIYQQMVQQADPPDNAYSLMLTALHQPLADETHHQWLEDALARKTNNEDTHPCLTDRLKALGYSTEQTQQFQPTALPVNAAEQLLGNALQQFVARFNQEWKIETATPWRQQYAHLQETQQKLQALDHKAEQRSLTHEEMWERARCVLELQGSEAGMPLLQAVVASQPDHAAANYSLGQILLHKNDAAGIACIEKAIAQQADWVLDGCELIYHFFLRNGQPQESQKYRDRAENHYQLLLQAQYERATVSDRDSFRPHTLEPSQIDALKQQLMSYSQIKEAYLVEKVVTYFPENRLCVLGIVRKSGLLENEGATQKLIDLLANNLKFPVQAYIVPLNNGNMAVLRKKICQVERALILKCSN
jgi:Zn-dependent protease with chaperone function